MGRKDAGLVARILDQSLVKSIISAESTTIFLRLRDGRELEDAAALAVNELLFPPGVGADATADVSTAVATEARALDDMFTALVGVPPVFTFKFGVLEAGREGVRPVNISMITW